MQGSHEGDRQLPAVGRRLYGSGYVRKRKRAEAGDGADPYCGSTSYRVCNRATLIACTPSTETREAVECR